MRHIRQALSVTAYDYRMWKKNIRVIATFLLTFILCFLLTDKTVSLAQEHGTTMQMFESFIWTFGDSNSILLISLLLVLLFSDMPFLSSATPLYLVRIDRKSWAVGQLIYIASATFLYMLFVLLSTMALSMKLSYPGNVWSATAAILGYSGEGEMVLLPVLVKTLEMSHPYQCTAVIFLLMLLYALLLVSVMLLFNILRGQQAGVISVFLFTVYGFVLSPATISNILKLPDELYYRANVIVGWVSPLNQATYHMHDFGYDRLPTLNQTYLIFLALIVLLFAMTLLAIRRYSFNFTGTEG